ncbi:MAG TPA: hypothetical protein VFS21_36900 [Roseiflexaceae bacterium]|nr:hypothetical protein [Roseiflexaceae bacterium]
MSLLAWVIIQTVVGVLGILPALGFQLATVMSGANMGTPLGTFTALAGYCFPFFLIGALVAMWICFALGWTAMTLVCLAAPWAYLLITVACLLLMFRSSGGSE